MKIRSSSRTSHNPPRLRAKMVLAFVTVVAIACAIAAVLLLWRAAEERAVLRQQLLASAVTLSNALDQEVAAMNYLLRGLSTAPALRSGDLKSFYEQLIATPVPEGSWLILHDLTGQVLNTLMPFGAILPRHSDYRTSAVERVRAAGWAVSGRTSSLLRPGASLVGLSLRVDSDGRPMKHFLTTIVSEVRLRQIMVDLGLSRISHTGAFDRDAQPLFDAPANSLVADPKVLEKLRSRLAGLERGRAIEDLIEISDARGDPVVVGLRRSGLTDWTSAAVTPATAIEAPLRSALAQIGGAFAFLLVIGVLASQYMNRQVERPLNALTTSVSSARQEVGELSEQLLMLQEDERQRIARELHDSTAQHLVAARLGLMHVIALADGMPGVLNACAEIEPSLDQALRELRIFTYLLHPPNLESEGLTKTIRQFVDGFCRRTGLRAAVRVSGGVDYLPFDLQRSILRVVQEAMANVQHHATASRVSLILRQRRGRLVLRVRDNGSGMAETVAASGPQHLGVGILGMRARLRQFGGELSIQTTSRGTTLIAVIPLTADERLWETTSSPSAQGLARSETLDG